MTKSEARFAFGKNWQAFLSVLNEDRIRKAEESLQEKLKITDLKGKRFLDIGCGSGLFSLAARRLGATVVSFDYDQDSVACAQTLKKRFFPDDSSWQIEQGSILDQKYIQSLGSFDVVYSWGVLHHTGSMWQSIENALIPLKSGGQFFIALYNDQGLLSTMWLIVKKIYNSFFFGKLLMLVIFVPVFILRTSAKSLLQRQNAFKQYKEQRGMSVVYDWFDWLGGLPFEVASIPAIKEYGQSKGLKLQTVFSTRSWGNNEFVFIKEG